MFGFAKFAAQLGICKEVQLSKNVDRPYLMTQSRKLMHEWWIFAGSAAGFGRMDDAAVVKVRLRKGALSINM